MLKYAFHSIDVQQAIPRLRSLLSQCVEFVIYGLYELVLCALASAFIVLSGFMYSYLLSC